MYCYVDVVKSALYVPDFLDIMKISNKKTSAQRNNKVYEKSIQNYKKFNTNALETKILKGLLRKNDRWYRLKPKLLRSWSKPLRVLSDFSVEFIPKSVYSKFCIFSKYSPINIKRFCITKRKTLIEDLSRKTIIRYHLFRTIIAYCDKLNICISISINIYFACLFVCIQ